MKTLKDYLAETIRRYGAVGTSPGMGYTLESSGTVDMKGKKCTACKKGTYQETSQHDDMDGVLHCDKCNTVVKSRQPATSTTSKERQDRALEKTKQTLSKPENMAVLKRLKTREGVAEGILGDIGNEIAHGVKGIKRQMAGKPSRQDVKNKYMDLTATARRAGNDAEAKKNGKRWEKVHTKTNSGMMEEQTMSRAAKGYEKYGRAGMTALAKAGREGRALDPVRQKYDQYNEGSAGDVEFPSALWVRSNMNLNNDQAHLLLYNFAKKIAAQHGLQDKVEKIYSLAQQAAISSEDHTAAGAKFKQLLKKYLDQGVTENAELRLILQRAKLIE